MNNSQKKILLLSILIIAVFLVLLIFSLVSLLSRGSTNEAAEEYERIAIENSLAKPADFEKKSGLKNSESNIRFANERIKKAILAKYKIMKTDVREEQSDLLAVDLKITSKDYSDALKLTKKEIDELNKEIQAYNIKSEKEFKDIGKEIIDKYSKGKAIIVNEKSDGDWAILTLTSPEGAGFSASTILKKVEGKWTIFLPPSSVFTKDEISRLEKEGAPKEIAGNANIKYLKDLLTPLKY